MTAHDVPTWRDVVRGVAEMLTSEREARWLVEHVTGLNAGQLAASLGETADPSVIATLEQLAARRRDGEPLQHVLGRWSFRTLELTVDRRALVPRPETEIVVGYALSELERRRAEIAHLDQPLRAVDLGTGGGAIACAIVAETEDVEVIATDVSADALALAGLNRLSLGRAAVRLELREGSWYDAIDDLRASLDCVVANPPYLSSDEWPVLDPVVREHDPYGALVAGPTGLEAYDAIVAGAGDFLVPGGALVLEIGSAQAEAVCELALGHGAATVEVARDLADRERVVIARWEAIRASPPPVAAAQRTSHR